MRLLVRIQPFALVLLIAAFAPALPASAAPETSTAQANPEALAVYEEGKKLYDAGDYLAARRKFLEAVRKDPENPRWHYNMGLAQRQLDNLHAARESFLRARALNPEYKKQEIDDKLRAMGFAADAVSTTPQVQTSDALPRDTTPLTVTHQEDASEDENDSSPAGLIAFAIASIVSIGAAIFLFKRLRRGSSAGKSTVVRIDQQAIAAARQRLQDLGAALIPIEHAMRLGEHPDLRSLLEHATLLETSARQALEKAKQGNNKALQQALQQINEAEQNASRAKTLATQLYGDQAFTGQGERIGCFFCARPLANAEVRQPVGMRRGTETDTVLACPDCAAQAARGEAPRIRTGNSQQQHWSDDPDFDPYTARHSDGSARRVPAWDFRPMQPVSTLAQQASGGALLGVGALAGAGAALVATHLLDLDALRAAEQTQKAAGETANRVRERNSSANDHS